MFARITINLREQIGRAIDDGRAFREAADRVNETVHQHELLDAIEAASRVLDV